jgi:hypothetical protein
MVDIKLLHNDDEVLGIDDSLKMRGSLLVDDKERGMWTEHTDGSWTAMLDGASLHAASKTALELAITAVLSQTRRV